jgi:hypothetical protein
MNREEIMPFLDKMVTLIDETGQQYNGFLTNYIVELDDEDNLIETVDLKPEDAIGYRFEFHLNQIKEIILI